MKSWLPIPADSDFSIHNIPFGIFKTADRGPRVGVAIGDYILDLSILADEKLLDRVPWPFQIAVFEKDTLNPFIELGKPITNRVRLRAQELLRDDCAELRDDAILKEKALVLQSDATMLMPLHIPNYTDFYSSMEHATNVGRMFRDPDNALLPNWKHLPVAYHGRASSIVVSGTPIHRPKGQTKADDAAAPVFGPTRLLDFELEVAFVTCKPTQMGESISTANAEDHIFGLVLFNDWSARDIQKWEYVPLGPFLAKNFGSTISPWVVTLEALEPFRTAGPVQHPQVLPYLQYEGKKNFDLNLQVEIVPENGSGQIVSNSNFKYMYWNMAQQLAHHTVNGCNICVGDLYASGTISGPSPDSFGSMLEITWQGKKPVLMPDGSERKFIADNDTVVLRGWGHRDGVRVGFGECSGKILSALP